MGCSGSKAAGIAAIPESSTGPIELTASSCTTVIDAKISGMFSKEMTATPQEQGVLFNHVSENAAKGLELVTSYPKMEMPEMPGMGAQMGMALGAPTTMEIKSTVQTFFKPVEAGKTLTTVLVYAPIHVDASVGFMNVQVNMQEGIGATINSYSAQGYRLCGMGIAGGATTTKFAGASSTSLAELVFQKVDPALPSSCMILQAAIKVSVNMGVMSSTVPDFAGTLNEYGAQGWSLDGFMMPPQAPPQVGAMSFNFDMAVQTYLSKPEADAQPKKYVTATYNYQMKVGVGGASLSGDPLPLIHEHAQKGWMLKGALSLPAQRKGMTGMAVPLMLFFEAPVVQQA